MHKPLILNTYNNFKHYFILFFISQLFIFQHSNASYLTAKGSKLYNDNGEVVRLTGVNWFGFETTNMFPHGLWARDYHGMLKQIREMGFNCIRIPFSDEMLHADTNADKPNFYGEDPYCLRDKTEFNKELAGLTPLQMLDEIIRYAGTLGLVIILDNHSREHDGYMNEKLWYTDKFSEKVWIDDWVMLAQRYKNNPAVIGFDLDNEPHGKADAGGATWGTGKSSTDWNTAAEKCGNEILKVNPDALIIIEGVEQCEDTSYWWGGNLRGVKNHPIELSHPDKLVYSPHEYGPEVFQQSWFFGSDFPGNMEKIWDDAFGFIAKQNIAPLFVGEFGISSMESYEGRTKKWFESFITYMKKIGCSFTFWALNPNSGDTGGMLSTDWITPVQWKIDGVKSLFAPLINEPIGVKKRKGFVQNRSIHRNGDILTLDGKWEQNAQLLLINMNGKTIHTSRNLSLSTKKITPGIYSVVYQTGTGIIKKVHFSQRFCILPSR